MSNPGPPFELPAYTPSPETVALTQFLEEMRQLSILAQSYANAPGSQAMIAQLSSQVVAKYNWAIARLQAGPSQRPAEEA